MNRFHPVIICLLTTVFATSPVRSLQKPPAPGQPQGELALNRIEEREISGAMPHDWTVPIQAGQYAELEVENTNIDVSIALVGADGAVAREFDRPGYSGSHTIRWIASAQVGGRVRITSIGLGALGRYRMLLRALGSPTARDHALVDADDMIRRGELERLARRHDAAETLLRQALQRIEDVSGPDSLETATVLTSLGDFYFRVGRYTDSAAAHERSLTLKQRLRGLDSPDAGVGLNNLGVVYHNQGKMRESERALLRALEIRARGLGPDHPRVGITLDNLAALYNDFGRFADAETSARRALVSSKVRLRVV